MALLPNRETCEKLCGFFFGTVFPLIPILHTKGFGADFRAFWDGLNTTNLHDSEPSLLMRKKPAFLSLLSAILFAALSSASPSRLEQMFEGTVALNAGDVYFMAMAAATLTGFPRRPSIYSLAAYVISQSQFVREEEFSDAPDFIATSFRIALGMGLHRQLSGSGFTAVEIETRRRLWWYILHLDVMSSSSSGLSPLFINRQMANADEICQYDTLDENGGAQEHSESSISPKTSGKPLNLSVDMRYLVASARYAITKEMRTILVLHFEDAFQSLDVVEKSASRLRTVATSTSAAIGTLLNVSETVDATASTVSQPGDQIHLDFDRAWTLRPNIQDVQIINFAAWSALLLHLMVHKAYCVLYHPLFRDPVIVADENIRAK